MASRVPVLQLTVRPNNGLCSTVFVLLKYSTDFFTNKNVSADTLALPPGAVTSPARGRLHPRHRGAAPSYNHLKS